MAQFLTGEKDGGPQILECHSPIMNLLEAYPDRQLTGWNKTCSHPSSDRPVRREEMRNSGLYECAFYFAL